MGGKIKAGLAGAVAVALIVGTFTGCRTGTDDSGETESTGEVSMITENNTAFNTSQESDTTSQSSTTVISSSEITSTTQSTGTKTTTTVTTTSNTTTTTKPKDTSSIQQDIAFYQEIIDSETAWLTSLQLENGALPMTYAATGQVTANPYFSDFAALALLDGDIKYYANVKKYMDWHFDRLNTAAQDYNGVDGTIYDYLITLSNGKIQSETVVINNNNKNQYDSTDSYAATFLMVLEKYYRKSGDTAYVKNHYNQVLRILNAMYSTFHNGLTSAKPDYLVKYLMDNTEVYAGFTAAIDLFEDVYVKAGNSGANAKLTQLKADRTKVINAIEDQMWNPKGYYETALFKDGSVAYNFDWSNFYPSATSQLFPVAFGVITPDSSRAKQLYDSFNKNFSTGKSKATWEIISIPDAFYWGSIPYTAALMGDGTRVKSYMTQYKKVMNRHAYPLYNADAGKVVSACKIMVDQLKSQL